MKRIWNCLIWKFDSIIMLCFAIIIAHIIWGKFARAPINYLQCIVQIVFVLIIYIWKYGMDTLKDSFQNMRGLFKTSDYNSVYQKFIDGLLWTGFETNNKRLIISAVKYFAVWIFVWIYLLYQLFHYKLFSFDLGGMTSAFLFSAAILLNGISYHSCINVVIFVKNIADLDDSKFKTMPYNKYLPSLTLDFQKFVYDANKGLTFFLMASLLFSIEYTALIFNNTEAFKKQLERSPQHFCFTTVMVLFLGLITFFCLYFLPIVFFKKIVKRWKENSIAEFETELITAENMGDTCLIESIIIKMEKIDSNQMKFEYPIINLIVALSTVLINIINVTVSIPSIYEFVLSMMS